MGQRSRSRDRLRARAFGVDRGTPREELYMKAASSTEGGPHRGAVLQRSAGAPNDQLGAPCNGCGGRPRAVRPTTTRQTASSAGRCVVQRVAPSTAPRGRPVITPAWALRRVRAHPVAGCAARHPRRRPACSRRGRNSLKHEGVSVRRLARRFKTHRTNGAGGRWHPGPRQWPSPSLRAPTRRRYRSGWDTPRSRSPSTVTVIFCRLSTSALRTVWRRPAAWLSPLVRTSCGQLAASGSVRSAPPGHNRRSRRWALRDSNPRPLPCKGSALAI